MYLYNCYLHLLNDIIKAYQIYLGKTLRHINETKFDFWAYVWNEKSKI